VILQWKPLKKRKNTNTSSFQSSTPDDRCNVILDNLLIVNATINPSIALHQTIIAEQNGQLIDALCKQISFWHMFVIINIPTSQ